MKSLASDHSFSKILLSISSFVLISGLMLMGCSQAAANAIEPSTIPEAEATFTVTSTKSLPAPTLTMVFTPTPTLTEGIVTDQTPSPMVIDTPNDNDSFLSYFRLTPQNPMTIGTNEPANSKYIYKYAIVTFSDPAFFGDDYLNLDDLNSNTLSNSDVLIDFTSGSGGIFFDLNPINGSTEYYSGLHGMSYDTCLEHFPFTNMDWLMNLIQTGNFGSGRDYCVLTNEGRLSIIRFVPGSIDEYDGDRAMMHYEVVITTYRQVIPQALTPYPTATEMTTPSADRYAGANLTEKQKAGLDRVAQELIDAVVAGDRKKVASLLEYPFAIFRGTKKYSDQANNEDEFLSVYGELFTPQVVGEFKNASIEENMGIDRGGNISLTLPNSTFYFHPDGKIFYIELPFVLMETAAAMPTRTPPEDTPTPNDHGHDIN